jgi:hypothetical protein
VAAGAGKIKPPSDSYCCRREKKIVKSNNEKRRVKAQIQKMQKKAKQNTEKYTHTQSNLTNGPKAFGVNRL